MLLIYNDCINFNEQGRSVGRSYAGVLGPLAFAVVLLRGALGDGRFETTLGSACLALWAFSAIGYVTGRIAEWIVEDSVRTRVSAELDAQQASPASTEQQAAAA